MSNYTVSFHPLENTLHTCSQFKYPEEQLPEDLQDLVNQKADKLAMVRVREFTQHFLTAMLPARKPKTLLLAYAISAGIPLKPILGTDTITGLAKLSGTSKQALSQQVQKIQEQLGLGKLSIQKEGNYTDSNIRHEAKEA